MMNRLLHDALRALLGLAVVLILLMQVVGLPWLSGELAREFPEVAHMRWPILALAILGLLAVQVSLICTIRLLGFTRRDAVFTARALPWVDGITGAFLAGGLVCLVTFVYQLTQEMGPPAWLLLLLMGTAAGGGLAMLMRVMRRLLVQASALRSEMDQVI